MFKLSVIVFVDCDLHDCTDKNLIFPDLVCRKGIFKRIIYGRKILQVCDCMQLVGVRAASGYL